MNTEKSLCTQGNWCVNTTLFGSCTYMFLYVDTGFSCERLCQKFFLVEKVTFCIRTCL